MSFGQDLKRERELRGISLQEIANSTKISMRFLEALEQDRLDLLPGKFFVKAILRVYAQSIGLEENSVLNRYYEASLREEQSRLAQGKPKMERGESPKKKKVLIGIVLLVTLILLSFVAFNLLRKEDASAPGEPQDTILIQKETPLPQPKVKRLYEIFAPENKLNLEISFFEETWLQVYADGEIKIDGLKEPGEITTIEAKEELFIHLGNAGGFTYKINDKKGKPLGPSGVSIRNLKITLDNYKKFIEEPID